MLATLSLLLTTSVQSRQPAKPETAEEILARMAKTYAECKSYRDSGMVTTVIFEEDRERSERKPFTTAFVRPNRFRYEFRDLTVGSRTDRYLIWREGPRVRVWWNIRPGIEECESLARAIAGATGVSGGSAQIVPGYLMPSEVKPWLMPGLRDLQRIEDASIAGTSCYRITGTRDASRYEPEVVTLWIDMRTALLRRIEERAQFDTFRTEETTEYEATLDEPIPESSLLFDPPEAPK